MTKVRLALYDSEHRPELIRLDTLGSVENQLWLRTIIMNPLTAESDLDALLQEIRAS